MTTELKEKTYKILLHGKSDSLELKAVHYEHDRGQAIFRDKDNVIVGDFPMHSVIGIYNNANGTFPYES